MGAVYGRLGEDALAAAPPLAVAAAAAAAGAEPPQTDSEKPNARPAATTAGLKKTWVQAREHLGQNG
eukprot:5381543-Pyramimonas_sp.AAC.1